MNYEKALELKNKNQHLIGENYNGTIIDDLILMPIDNEIAKEVRSRYIISLNAEEAIYPFTNTDLDVVAVSDQYRIKTKALFFQTSIFNIPNAIKE